MSNPFETIRLPRRAVGLAPVALAACVKSDTTPHQPVEPLSDERQHILEKLIEFIKETKPTKAVNPQERKLEHVFLERNLRAEVFVSPEKKKGSAKKGSSTKRYPLSTNLQLIAISEEFLSGDPIEWDGEISLKKITPPHVNRKGFEKWAAGVLGMNEEENQEIERWIVRAIPILDSNGNTQYEWKFNLMREIKEKKLVTYIEENPQ